MPKYSGQWANLGRRHINETHGTPNNRPWNQLGLENFYPNSRTTIDQKLTM